MLASIANDLPLRAFRLDCRLSRIGVRTTPKTSAQSDYSEKGADKAPTRIVLSGSAENPVGFGRDQLTTSCCLAELALEGWVGCRVPGETRMVTPRSA